MYSFIFKNKSLIKLYAGIKVYLILKRFLLYINNNELIFFFCRVFTKVKSRSAHMKSHKQDNDKKNRCEWCGLSHLISEKNVFSLWKIFFPNFKENPMLNICSFCNIAEILKYCRFGAVLRSKTNLPSFASIPLFCLQCVFCYRRYF